MNRYINTANASQLFDPADVLHTASQTAQDLERIYNRFAGGSDATDVGTMPDESATGGGDPGIYYPNPDRDSGKSNDTTNYIPYIIAGGVAIILVLWLAYGTSSKH